MTAVAALSRGKRWLLEVLCVIFGVIGAVSDVIDGPAPGQIMSLLGVVSFLGFAAALFLKTRHYRSLLQMARSLIPTVVAVVLGSYAVLFPLVYFLQDTFADRTSLFFQQWPLSSEAAHSYASQRLELLEFVAADGIRLRGWLVKNATEARAPLLIYFGGSGSTSSEIIAPAQRLDGWLVAIVSYRGFGLSEGRPTHANVLADALLIYDALSGRPDVDREHIVAMGYSLGTGVAVYLAAERKVAGAVLVAPFDRMTLTGVKASLPAAPLQPLMKHYFDSGARAPGISAPLLCLIGLRDRDVPPELSLKLADLWGGEKTVEVYWNDDHDLLWHDNSSWSDIAGFLGTIAASGP